MANFTQSERPLEIDTPLGRDVLLLTRFQGVEEMSRLFRFEVGLIAEPDSPVKFEKILGQPVTVRLDLTDGTKRYFNGIVSRFTQAARSDRGFGVFRAEVVPSFWTLTRKIRSRTFQHLSVPEILRQVLVGFETSFRLIETYPPRDYCVQYRESDFQFASRLMEEEGIAYLFEHRKDRHTMVITDHLKLDVEGAKSVLYDQEEGALATDMRVTGWEKTQEIQAGEYTFWDHCFEMPDKHLEAKRPIPDSLKAGIVDHKLKLPVNAEWEIYDYPGSYARRFDGMDTMGTPQAQGIDHIFEDRDRTIRIRTQQAESASIDIRGVSYCGNFSAGHKFRLERHFDADGEYLLTRVEHEAVLEDYQSGEERPFRYSNQFRCVPAAVHFRPQPVTPRPIVNGVQTAVVVGPPGEEIFVDQYGRVKVQFFWDREGKRNAHSSCWLRVSQFWAGKSWGAFFWPRIGHEVVVAFEEGDPDQPIIVGSVYNGENHPYFELPLCKDFAGVKSESTRGNAHEHYNGIVMVDRKGEEHLHIHSERHMIFNTEFDRRFYSGRHQGERVPGYKMTTVGGIPGTGGGSGGDPDKDIWQQPTEQAFAGFNATSVYGINFQNAAPVNFQLAMPNNLQLCINPTSLFNTFGIDSPIDGPMAGALGTGIAGNMQLTLGNSTNFVIGQSYDINIGPGRLVVDVHRIEKYNQPCRVIAFLMLAFTIVFEIGYLLIEHDDGRTILSVLYTLLTEYSLMILMAFQDLSHKIDNKTKAALEALFKANPSLDKNSQEAILKLLDDEDGPDPTAVSGNDQLAMGAWFAATAGFIVVGAGVSEAEKALKIQDEKQNEAAADVNKGPDTPPDTGPLFAPGQPVF